MVTVPVSGRRVGIQGVTSAGGLVVIRPCVVVVIVVDGVRGRVAGRAVEHGRTEVVGQSVTVSVEAYAWVQWIQVVLVKGPVVVVIGVEVGDAARDRDDDVVDPDSVLVAADAGVLPVHPRVGVEPGGHRELVCPCGDAGPAHGEPGGPQAAGRVVDAEDQEVPVGLGTRLVRELAGAVDPVDDDLQLGALALTDVSGFGGVDTADYGVTLDEPVRHVAAGRPSATERAGLEVAAEGRWSGVVRYAVAVGVDPGAAVVWERILVVGDVVAVVVGVGVVADAVAVEVRRLGRVVREGVVGVEDSVVVVVVIGVVADSVLIVVDLLVRIQRELVVVVVGAVVVVVGVLHVAVAVAVGVGVLVVIVRTVVHEVVPSVVVVIQIEVKAVGGHHHVVDVDRLRAGVRCELDHQVARARDVCRNSRPSALHRCEVDVDVVAVGVQDGRGRGGADPADGDVVGRLPAGALDEDVERYAVCIGDGLEGQLRDAVDIGHLVALRAVGVGTDSARVAGDSEVVAVSQTDAARADVGSIVA